MKNNSSHTMFPEANHDEQAAQSFIKSLRIFSMQNFHQGNRKLLDNKILSDNDKNFVPTRKEMREALSVEPHNQWWSSMMRTTQEMLYDTVGPSVERQLDNLIEKSESLKNKLGSLKLDKEVLIPTYLNAVDMHCKPGSYQQEIRENDIFAGAEFDRTYRLYSMGALGKDLDGLGRTLINWLKENYASFTPKNILDIGCTVGHSTLPYCEFDNATVHAIDVAAPCLRYGHARAVAMKKQVHFSQQNAEKTNFSDNTFDLIVSHAMLHETSHKAIRNIFKECYRILKSGGLMIHVDGIHTNKPHEKYYSDWMSVYNNEPYLGTIQDENFIEICSLAGFHNDKIKIDEKDSELLSLAVICAEK
tara:strand:- start:483 stop:1565 length:1083 start_codon:yes stop_codon:yes gene_type:complete